MQKFGYPTIEIKSKLAHDVLLRSINAEIKNMVETMDKCNQDDFMEYQIFYRAQDQYQELVCIRKQLIDNTIKFIKKGV